MTADASIRGTGGPWQAIPMRATVWIRQQRDPPDETGLEALMRLPLRASPALVHHERSAVVVSDGGLQVSMPTR